MTGPKVVSHAPSATVGIDQTSLRFTFDEYIRLSSFSIADDVAAFTGPDGEDIKDAITSYAWVDKRTLDVSFQPVLKAGRYTMTLGQGILPAGQSVTRVQSLTLPANGTDGAYRIVVVADIWHR